MAASNDFFYELRMMLYGFIPKEQHKDLDALLYEFQSRWRGEKIYIGLDDTYYDQRAVKIRAELNEFMRHLAHKHGLGTTERVRQIATGTPVRKPPPYEESQQELFQNQTPFPF